MMQTDTPARSIGMAAGGPLRARWAVRGLTAILFWGLLWGAGGVGLSATPEPPAKNKLGFRYIHDEDRRVPWSMHVLKVERGHPQLELQTVLGQGTQLGLATVSDQIRKIPSEWGRPIGAINGDFYNYSISCRGDPQGLQITRGELISAPVATDVCLWVDATGNPHRAVVRSQFKVTWPNGTTSPLGLNEGRSTTGMVLYTAAIGPSTLAAGGQELVLERSEKESWLPLQIGRTYNARVREIRSDGNTPMKPEILVLSAGPGAAAAIPKVKVGDVLKISLGTTPDLTGASTAIGGGPTLVQAGKSTHLSDSLGRHPRTAVGWNKEHFFLVVVDGRQANLSMGMTLSELSAYMIKLTCEEAINLDGGGSATIWVMGNVVNSPSPGRERPSANTLVVLQKPAAK